MQRVDLPQVEQAVRRRSASFGCPTQPVSENDAMKISSLMIPNPITVAPEASISEAIEVMKINSIRHLPVVSPDDRLIGFITLADLKQGLIPSMLADVDLTDLMISNPITVHPEDDVEKAARLIYEHKIGGLPVVEDGRLVGIITESDILRTFIDMMGILSSSSRIDVLVGNEPAALNRALRTLDDNGGDVINVAMTMAQGERRTYHFRLSACDTRPLEKALKKEGFTVL